MCCCALYFCFLGPRGGNDLQLKKAWNDDVAAHRQNKKEAANQTQQVLGTVASCCHCSLFIAFGWLFGLLVYSRVVQIVEWTWLS